MINGAPQGTLNLATTSGWITSDVKDHFVKFTLSSKENSTLLVMHNNQARDNDSSTLNGSTTDISSSKEIAKQNEFLSLEQFKGFPKAKLGKGNTNRRKGKSMTATDTSDKFNRRKGAK
ncbi:hypothetical protein ILUMI_10143 [Ignelater luminosus]|uniref:Uncharacterized protein n=1 Tax=Ignelater luminosus TaxID=2038154 RepID=A0A8K0CYG4_IGNLU|nr:hypothetical protein ILUMI_10143 [Ignelater luminosus]